MARSFNGTTDFINCGADSGLVGTAVTISAWVNFSTGTVSNYVSICADNTLWKLYIRKDSGKFSIYFGSSGSYDNTGTFTITAGTWHHYLMTYAGGAGGTVNAYVDGSLDATFAGTTSANSGFGIGSDTYNSWNNGFKGSLADVALWTGITLSTGEILALSKGARPFSIRPSSIKRYYPLDGLQSPEPDLSGNALNGTLTGTSLGFGPPLMMFTPRWPQLLIASAPVPQVLFAQTVM